MICHHKKRFDRRRAKGGKSFFFFVKKIQQSRTSKGGNQRDLTACGCISVPSRCRAVSVRCVSLLQRRLVSVWFCILFGSA